MRNPRWSADPRGFFLVVSLPAQPESSRLLSGRGPDSAMAGSGAYDLVEFRRAGYLSSGFRRKTILPDVSSANAAEPGIDVVRVAALSALQAGLRGRIRLLGILRHGRRGGS